MSCVCVSRCCEEELAQPKALALGVSLPTAIGRPATLKVVVWSTVEAQILSWISPQFHDMLWINLFLSFFVYFWQISIIQVVYSCTAYTIRKCEDCVQSVQRQFGVGRNCDLPPTATGHRQIYCPFQYIIISGDRQKKQTKVIIRDIILGRPWLSSRRLDGNVSCRQHNCFASTPFTLSSFSLCS